ncbi:MAG: bifunctional diaminohydroxyphosphoribosylaminopyrimidine deaminase/5-amino-6-(5-phosphoribosylamino)uracil reductase RibD [Thermoleophilia bacterium]
MKLAERGRGRTSPNPMVGALVVRDGRVLGEGFHAAPGEDHAEIAAMKAAVGEDFTGRLRGATMVVTLEPCCHHGRTPPCADALISAGIGRVVVGAVDPSQHINGRGLERLREAGVEVEVAEGGLAYRLRRQNDAFRKQVTQGLPFVTYKYAMTLDGRVATEGGSSKWISGAESRSRVQQLRSWSDAVMVGAGTLRADDPELTVREIPVRRQPLRVVVDSRLELDPDCRLLQTASKGSVLVVTTEGASGELRARIEERGAQVVAVPADERGLCSAGHVARELAKRGVQSLLLEGGPRLAGSWWDAGLIDKVIAFVAPVLAGGAAAPGPLPGAGAALMQEAVRLRDLEIEQIGTDVVVSGYLGEPV